MAGLIFCIIPFLILASRYRVCKVLGNSRGDLYGPVIGIPLTLLNIASELGKAKTPVTDKQNNNTKLVKLLRWQAQRLPLY